MIILWYVLYTIADLVFTLFSVLFVNWWAPFFAVSGNIYVQQTRGYTNCQMLPAWLKWFDTFDASTDAGWVDKYFSSKYTLTSPPSYWLRKWYQIRWLYRNPGYGFSYWVLGVPFDPTAWKVVKYNPSTAYFKAEGNNGLFNVEISFMSLKLGWKAWNYYDPTTGQFKSQPWGPELRVPHCFTIIPKF